jgi:hypothetical protein
MGQWNIGMLEGWLIRIQAIFYLMVSTSFISNPFFQHSIIPIVTCPRLLFNEERDEVN